MHRIGPLIEKIIMVSGSVSHSQVSNNSSYVIDQDWVDTPIENNPSILFDGNRAGNQNEIDIGEIK